MKRIAFLVSGIGLFVFVAGCGPLTSPMVPRLTDEEQKGVDEMWEKALTPVNRLDHQFVLDVLVYTRAYQNGVDKLYCRSEKRFSGGMVVMEIHYDRAVPADDRFEVKVLDPDGKLLREERYNRSEVEKTYDDLYVQVPRSLKEGEKEPPELAEKRARYEARLAKIQEYFPDPDRKKKAK